MTLFSKETKESIKQGIEVFLEDWQVYFFFAFILIVLVLMTSYMIFSGLTAMSVVIPYWLVIFAIVVVVPALAVLFIFVWDNLPCCEL